MQICRMHKPSKSKAEPTDAETLRALQFALAPLPLEDRKPSYWDKIMSDPNRNDRYEDAKCEADMQARHEYYGQEDQ